MNGGRVLVWGWGWRSRWDVHSGELSDDLDVGEEREGTVWSEAGCLVTAAR